MKLKKSLVRVLLILLMGQAAAESRTDAVAEFGRAEKVRDILLVFPHVEASREPSTELELKAALRAPEIKVESVHIQTISDLLGAVSSDKATKCKMENDNVIGFLLVEFKDGHVEEYLITETRLIGRIDGECHSQSKWVARSLELLKDR